MELTGHAGEVFVARFDPTGAFVASGSMDRRICKSARRQRIVETDSMMLIFGCPNSSLECSWRMPKLWGLDWTPCRHIGSSMVSGLKHPFLSIGRFAYR